MYKLAIIDDEPLIQRGLHSLVHYRELSLLPCDFVNTGKDALTLILTQHPDIVLLDIVMPDLNGIDVIERVRKEADYAPVFLILSNHQDFSYAQMALHLGALDFITKIEVNETILNTALQKAIEMIPEKESVLRQADASSTDTAAGKNARNTFFDRLLNHFYADQNETDLKQDLKKYGINGSYYGAACFKLSGLLPEENNVRITATAAELIEDYLKKYMSCYVSLWTTDTIVCILGLTEDSANSLLADTFVSASNMVHRYTNKRTKTAVGICSSDPRRISLSFTQSQILCNRALPGGNILFAKDEEPLTEDEETTEQFHLCNYREELTEAFISNDSAKITQIFEQITTQYISPESPLHNVLSICFSMFHFISTMLPNKGTFTPALFGEYRDPVESIRNIQTQQEAMDYLRMLRDALCSHLDENLLHSGNWLITDICSYIDQHSTEPLSLQEVADAFDRSPTYVSSLFKKHRNIGFAEYVRNARLARAKQLLQQGYKIKDVTDMLGFSDPYYFNKVFRKAENMSPSDYIHSLQARPTHT